MTILNITEVSGRVSYLQFYLELTKHTHFEFKMSNKKKDRKKLENILYKKYAGLWHHKTILSLISKYHRPQFYYKNGYFTYYNAFQFTEVPIEDEHIEIIKNFLYP